MANLEITAQAIDSISESIDVIEVFTPEFINGLEKLKKAVEKLEDVAKERYMNVLDTNKQKEMTFGTIKVQKVERYSKILNDDPIVLLGTDDFAKFVKVEYKVNTKAVEEFQNQEENKDHRLPLCVDEVLSSTFVQWKEIKPKKRIVKPQVNALSGINWKKK